jgi:hypothetical protein
LAAEPEPTEERFRNANERLKSRLGDLAWEDRIPFVCECADPGCLEVVDLTMAEYETVRAHGAAFFVAPGHEAHLDGHAAEQSERYVVVVTT